MKTITFILCLFIIVTTSFGVNEIDNKKLSETLKILKEVNTNWKQEDLSFILNDLLKINLTNLKREPIKYHLKFVEKILRHRRPSNLTVHQETKRNLNLDYLKYYWESGNFPTNSFHETSTPYFVDIFGIHCAVGFMLKNEGVVELIRKIKEENNYLFIDELNNKYTELVLWSQDNGFTMKELSWIQPTYPPQQQDMLPIGNGGGVDGHVNIMKANPEASILYMAGNFTSIDGFAANSIVGWDGDNWMNFGTGVDGEIFDIHFHNNKLHISGDFKIHGEENFANIAYWENNTWVKLQDGDSGVIYKMETYQEQLYIGGGFESLDGDDFSFLAYYDEQTLSWSNSSIVLENGELINLPGIFSVNDTVWTLAVFDDRLFVGGQFDELHPDVNHPNVINHEVSSLAAWFGYLWLAVEENNMEYINKLQPVGDSLFLFGPMDIVNYLLYSEPMQIYHDGEIEIPFSNSAPFWILDENKPPLVYGYLYHNEEHYIYGNIIPSWTVNGGGLDNLNGIQDGCFDAPVLAAAVFKGNIYFAGDFTEAFDVPLNGLAYSSWGVSPVNIEAHSNQNLDVNYYLSNKQLIIESQINSLDCILRIYSLTGQLVEKYDLNENAREVIINLSDLHDGMYVFHFMNSEYQQSEILSLF